MKKLILFLFLVSPYSALLSHKPCDYCDIKLNHFVKDDSLFKIVDSMPTFKGERQNYFLTYIYENLHIKKKWLYEIEYQYTVSFVIDKKGRIVRVKIGDKDKIEYNKIEKEIFKVIKKAPKWDLGRCQGQPVPIYVKTVLRLNISG